MVSGFLIAVGSTLILTAGCPDAPSSLARPNLGRIRPAVEGSARPRENPTGGNDGHDGSINTEPIGIVLPHVHPPLPQACCTRAGQARQPRPPEGSRQRPGEPPFRHAPGHRDRFPPPHQEPTPQPNP